MTFGLWGGTKRQVARLQDQPRRVCLRLCDRDLKSSAITADFKVMFGSAFTTLINALDTGRFSECSARIRW